MKALERLDEQIIDREPDRPAPVRVAAEDVGLRLPRLVANCVLLAVDDQCEGVIQMHARERAHAVRREKLVLVEHIPQHADQPLPARHGE